MPYWLVKFLEKTHKRGTGLMLKDNVDSKFDFIGTLEPNAPLSEDAEDQKTAW